MTRRLMIAAALQVAFATAALACEGQSGVSIFEDKFADDSGGWDMSFSNIKIVPPAMQIELNKDISAGATMNLTFNANNGDYCQEVVFPPPVAGNPLSSGIQFWGLDASNLFMFLVGDDANAALYKKVNNVWSAIFTGVKVDGFNTAPGTVHTLLVQAKAGVLTLSVDGIKVKSVRAQMPPGPLQFGIFAQASLPADPPVTVKITGFSVTAGQ
ncbi:MAG: hypothetical protein NTV73_14885 [Hyphomicrobiales bacterium]|nr:hypothetical protein [Hyphomicrobiales bacterium]